MVKNNSFYHSLIIREDRCNGCTHCMRSCPTGALRIVDGIARLTSEKCVDCGYCLKVCPVSAIVVEDDDFDLIFKYKNRVALVPAIFLSQFDARHTISMLYSTLHELGFTHIFETESTVEFLLKITRDKINESKNNKLFISAFCPAVVRLIQIRFPSLVTNIIPLKAPLQLTAAFVREKFNSEGFSSDETGVFYITPCAAKIADVKACINETAITGVINMNFMYNRMMSKLSKPQGSDFPLSENDPFSLTKRSMTYTLTHGEALSFDGRCLAVDEIHNVIEFLEKLENEEVTVPDYLELRACDQGCAGGVLTVENRFLAAEKLRDRAEQAKYFPENIAALQKTIFKKYDFLLLHALLKPLKPNSMFKFAGDYESAMKQYNVYREILNSLPHVDCGVCGSPSCKDFAEDVARGNKEIKHCVFIQRGIEKSRVENSENMQYFEQIWGKEKIDINKNKSDES